MEVAAERPPVKEEKRADDVKPEIAPTQIGNALPIVFESFQSPQRASSMKQEDSNSRLEAEMGEVKEENERLKTLLSRIVSDYQSLQMHFLDVVKVREQAANKEKPLPAETAAPAPPRPVAEDDADQDLVSLSLGTRSSGGGARRKGHARSSSSSGTAGDIQLSLGLGFARPSTDNEKASVAGPVLNMSSDSSSADQDTAKVSGEADACRPGETRKSPSAGGEGADDEVQQQAKKTRVSVRVKCDTPTMNDGCQWRKYGQKISKGNPCPRAYYRCTVAPNCPVRKQVQRCNEDKTILITTYEGAHNHQLPPAATAMASTTSAAAAMLTAGSTTSATFTLARHLHFPPASAAGLLGPTTTMVTTAASCPTITIDLTAPAPSLLHSSPYPGGGYDSKALPAAWSSEFPAYGGGGQMPSYYAASKSSPSMGHHLFGGGQSLPSRSDQLFGHQSSVSYLQQLTSLGGAQSTAVAPAVTDTLAKAITSDPSFQSALAVMITSYMGRGEAAQK